MINNTVLLLSAYLTACGIAWFLHESAHYVVHTLYAESVSFGVNRRGPYVDAVYSPSAPVLALRIGSIAPTLIYTPIVAIGIFAYRSMYPLPQLDPVGWTFVVVPFVILIVPTGADIQGYLITGE